MVKTKVKKHTRKISKERLARRKINITFPLIKKFARTQLSVRKDPDSDNLFYVLHDEEIVRVFPRKTPAIAWAKNAIKRGYHLAGFDW